MRMTTSTTIQRAALSAAMAASFLLSGCGLGGSSTGSAVSNPLAHAQVSGKVFGGQQPVVGATIQLYTVGTTAGGASTALIASPGVSLAGGVFSISGSYSCTSATQVYITATGGDAGSGPNGSLSLMAALGSCAALQANAATTFIQMNELTTVAAVYALAPFMTDYTHVSAAGVNPTGLVNAFATANALVNTGTGNVASTTAGLTLPSTRLNTLANILAACVNTNGSTSTQCHTLLTATGASETIGAGLAIAKNPGSSAFTALYSLGSATPPFVPALTAQPNDFTLAVNYTGAELLSPYGLAIDASGNAWVTNESGFSITKLPSLSTSFATITYSNGGIIAPRGISIDKSGNIWVANTGGNNVVELNSAGSPYGSSPYTVGGISVPVAVANDSIGNAWVANFAGSSITKLGAGGTSSGVNPIGVGSLNLPTALSIDSSGNVLVANEGSGSLCIYTNSAVAQGCVSDGLLFGATANAVSKTSAVAMAGSTTGPVVTGAFTLGTSSGAVNAASPVTGGGLTLPVAVAYDGTGNAWFANTSSISEFSGATAISPVSGLGLLNTPSGIAVDASGNVWTTNSGDNSVSVFIGLASPASVPLAVTAGP